MTHLQMRIAATATVLSLAGVLALQGRWLWLGYRDARSTFDRRVDLMLAATAERIDPGDEVFRDIVAVVDPRDAKVPPDAATIRAALAGIRGKIDLELAGTTLPRQYTAVLGRWAEPAALWTDPPARDNGGARTVRLHRVCPACDARIGVAFEDVTPRIFLAEIAGILGLSVVLMCALVAGVVTAFTGIARLRQQQEFQTAFINTVAHEFRTPLFAISVAGKLLGDAAPVRDNVDLSAQVALIRRAKDRLLQHTDRLLGLAALRAGRHPLVREPVDVHELVRRAAAELDAVREAAGASLRAELGAEDALVHGDASQLEQAVVNLLDNAFKYGGSPAEVVLRTRRNGSTLCIEVEDNGSGIAPRQREEIFAPFVRGAIGARHDVKGFGLGLSHVREVATLHGGSIAVFEGRNGQGSRFVLTLPVATS